MIRSYKELRHLKTFEDRYNYLRLGGVVGRETFGFDRYLNQMLYKSAPWLSTRNSIIIRDNACDLGIPEYDIRSGILVHHLNPISIEDIELCRDCVFDPDNLITTTLNTHNAIHYGDATLLVKLPIERTKGDTTLWTTAY